MSNEPTMQLPEPGTAKKDACAERIIKVPLMDTVFDPAEKDDYDTRFLLEPGQFLKPAKCLYLKCRQGAPLEKGELQKRFWYHAKIKNDRITFTPELYKLMQRTYIVLHASNHMPNLNGKRMRLEKSVNWDQYRLRQDFTYNEVLTHALLETMGGRKFHLCCRTDEKGSRITVNDPKRGTYTMDCSDILKHGCSRIILESEFDDCQIRLHIRFQ